MESPTAELKRTARSQAQAAQPPRLPPAEPNGSEILVRCLQAEGVKVLWGYPGGAVLYIYDALYQQDLIRHVLKIPGTRPGQIRHESEHRDRLRTIRIAVGDPGHHLILRVADPHVEDRKAAAGEHVRVDAIGDPLADRRVRDHDDRERKRRRLLLNP